MIRLEAGVVLAVALRAVQRLRLVSRRWRYDVILGFERAGELTLPVPVEACPVQVQ
ncbi:MAG: hypothetical protein WAL26_06030 [Mycobacterium sp.]